MRGWLLACALVACTTGEGSTPRPAPLPALPPPQPVQTDRFRDGEACGQCHLVPDSNTTVLHDGTGANVSPVLLWRSSLMAMAARDPFYLAVFAEELAKAPGRADQIEPLCTRCHGPAGSEELAAHGQHLTFDDLTSGTSPAALLARGGVTCTLCHQIAAGNLGSESSFTGGFTVGYARQLFGRYGDPMTSPMQLIVNYTPTLGDHIAKAELCATCHTVIVDAPAGQVVEQATYLEWRSSSFPADGKPCQACHVPASDDAGNPIDVPIAGFPAGLSPRMPFGKHVFVGGNSYVLQLLADAIDWSGAAIPASELKASAARDEAHLRTAAKLSIVDAHREGDTAVVTVRVENETGHKLPTGYPSRRMWLHVTAGAFESGAPATLAAPQPHRDTITSPDQAQIWEAQLVDPSGHVTHRTLGASGYAKDDRILPKGFAPTAADAARTDPIGTGGDASFVPGSDDVTYRMTGVAAGTPIAIELLYEAVRPDIVDAIDTSSTPTPAGVQLVNLARARPPAPVAIATLTATAP